ncbi:MAG: hypothetical protein C0478_09130 [Planctomyces sp.]|nr:hypothetical protein [Planctomyces sp.]
MTAATTLTRPLTGLWINEDETPACPDQWKTWAEDHHLRFTQVSLLNEAVQIWQRGEAAPGSGLIELIVIEQASSDQFSPAQVDDFLAEVQGCQIIVIHGPWCEGDGRTRNTWPPALRCPAAWAPLWIRQTAAALRGDGEALPWTASREEVIRWLMAGRPLEQLQHRITVLSPDHAWKETMAHLLGSGVNHSEGEKLPPETAAWWIVDADAWLCQSTSKTHFPSPPQSLGQFAEIIAGQPQSASTRLLAMTSWNDETTHRLLIEQGAQAVSPKLSFDSLSLALLRT